ncbi:MAG: hypothetical protein HGA76_06830 [Candidatus Firestonebacteria bacterium]|nr:hypothetical protein [Candidatus Firestonebacteria bacterium]
MAFFDGVKKWFGKKTEPGVSGSENPEATPAEAPPPPVASETPPPAPTVETPMVESTPQVEGNSAQVLPLFISEQAPEMPAAAVIEPSVSVTDATPEPGPEKTEPPLSAIKPVFPARASILDEPDALDTPGLSHVERAGTIDLEDTQAKGGDEHTVLNASEIVPAGQNLTLDFNADSAGVEPVDLTKAEIPPIEIETAKETPDREMGNVFPTEEPKTAEPKAEEPEAVKPEAVKPEAVKPEAEEPEAEEAESEDALDENDEPGERDPFRAKITHMSELLPPAPPPVKTRAKADSREKNPNQGKARAKSVRRERTVSEPLSAPRTRNARLSRPETDRAARPRVRFNEYRRDLEAPLVPRRSAQAWVWVAFVFTALICLGLGAAGTFYWYENGPNKSKVAEKIAQERARGEKIIGALKAELENERIAQMNMRTGEKRLFELLNGVHQDWSRLPAKPEYFKPNKGIVIFWIDRLIWRQYYVYQGKGADGPMTRINPTPDKRNFVYLKNLPKGLWRFSVSALTKEGKETPRSEELIIRSP